MYFGAFSSLLIVFFRWQSASGRTYTPSNPVLHHFNLKSPVGAVEFSRDGKFIAFSTEALVHVYNTPNILMREFAPWRLHRTYAGHSGEVNGVTWSGDDKFFLSFGTDLTAKLFSLQPVEDFRPKTFAGHRDSVIGAWFGGRSQDSKIYTVSRDGALFIWGGKQDETTVEDEERLQKDPQNRLGHTRWGILQRHYFNQPNTKVTSAAFYEKGNLLVVGFGSGVFSLWELPSSTSVGNDITSIHTLSISNERISSVAINSTGQWLAFGAQKLGQLLVWEWQSQSYILKQQAHAHQSSSSISHSSITHLSYSSTSQQIATSGSDGKVKLWSTQSGFCFVTFSEHSASVTGVEFAKRGQIIFSASLDGTVRGWDLVRYRNFRTFTSPTERPVQFNCLAVDQSGELVVAGSNDTYEIFFWSVQSGKLLDILTGHTGPVSSLAFSPVGNTLASGSWDKSVRIWDVVGRSRAVEPISMNSDVLAVSYRPDGRELAVATLDGQIAFFEEETGRQTGIIDGRRDISGGRSIHDGLTAQNNAGGKAFNSLSYSGDGTLLLAGGNSKYVCLYDIRESTLLRKFTISENLSLDGTEEMLDSRRVNSAGINVDALDNHEDDSDAGDRLAGSKTLPGVMGGDLSKRKWKPTIRTSCIRFAPDGRGWAAASTEGLLLYSNEDLVTFDPFDLSLDLTPQSTFETLANKEYLKALCMAMRLNEETLVTRVFEGIPTTEIRFVVGNLPLGSAGANGSETAYYLRKLMELLVKRIDKGPHLESDLRWIIEILERHGTMLRGRSGGDGSDWAGVLRGLARGMTEVQKTVSTLCEDNINTLEYLIDQSIVHERSRMDIDTSA
ncbi:Periodic tryptophan protein 2 AltName: Full=U three protein 1; AltName: Full=U3 small nucleolar RNA-associated protein 1; Short=U3 snoRNA-associated protein 1 [Serendipita indica DSM 11827]|nr:Periodic tryptophan protein 2 AltName: Full=U three protein 1; AltName: Full=U3 small nucleolar RNA-associated protein 1; Short=U3 snoRNA-associated protein 1 [Serendipita indica DSM 11827]